MGYALPTVKNFQKGAPKQKLAVQLWRPLPGFPYVQIFPQRIKRKKTSAIE